MACRPQVSEGLGEKSQFKDLGMEKKSHQKADFEEHSNFFKIELKAPENVKSICTLNRYSADGKEEDKAENQVFIEKHGKRLVYRVAVTEPGWHKLNIFACEDDTQTQSLPCVYTYLVNVKQMKHTPFPYPKQYADWKRGCYLHEPRWIDTKSDLSQVKFKVDVPGANRVAVMSEDEWTHLEKKNGNTWEGKVNLTSHNKPGTLVGLNACMGSDQTKFATLLHYTL